MHIITQTNRLTIREFLSDELETYLAHFTDERVKLYLPKRSTEERITIFNNNLIQYQTTKECGIWGIFDRTNDELIGTCVLRHYNDEPALLELGYSLDHKYWGQGIGTEMAQAVATYGLTKTSIAAIVACTELPNIASQKVLLKTGFKRDGNIIKDDLELAFFRLTR